MKAKLGRRRAKLDPQYIDSPPPLPSTRVSECMATSILIPRISQTQSPWRPHPTPPNGTYAGSTTVT